MRGVRTAYKTNYVAKTKSDWKRIRTICKYGWIRLVRIFSGLFRYDETYEPSDTSSQESEPEENEAEENEVNKVKVQNKYFLVSNWALSTWIWFCRKLWLAILLPKFDHSRFCWHFFHRWFFKSPCCANLYANQEIGKRRPIRRSSRLTRWKDVDSAEMKIFLGLLLHMGPCTLPSIEHYWSTDILYKMSFWSSIIMSRNRF